MPVDLLARVLTQRGRRVKPDDLPFNDAYEIELRWKEEVVYWEGDRGFSMDAGWGVEPPVVYVPSTALWDRVVPPWLLGRRAEVVDKLVQRSKHVVRDTDGGYSPGDDYRSVTR